MARVALVFLLAWLLLGCAPPARYSVVLLGDSITHGIVSGENADDAPSYAELLASELGGEFRVVNIGCSGASSLDWTLSRGDPKCGHEGEQLPMLYPARALPNLPADLVTIMLGANDAGGFLEEAPIEPRVYIAAIAEIAGNLRRDGAERVLLIPAPQNFAGRPPVQGRLRAYRDAVQGLCDADVAIECGPDLFELMTPAEFTQSVHPNAAGHRRIAALLAPAIRERLID